ncbi:TrwC relaxase [[Pseudopropionibacterium] massiliense]|uniref:TrwC relaxase n=1 Tax=[Pseudopropionibacterium] massiliense TaxID=2220000 RepID=UPI001FEBCB82|nr:TrwC relaxase [[Pseudopropionibacterium] massiliense]
MTDAAYTAWRHDRQQGLASVLIAETRENVTTLNVRARAALILDGTLKPGPEITLSDGSMTGVGDTIITRHNDRRLRNRHGWVRNSQTWTISQVRGDGPVTIRPPGARFGNSIVLPAEYVAEHVDLGYADTAHRAQGITADTAHVLVEPTTTRENLYVAMTRGRESNLACVILDRPDGHATPHPGDNPDATARTVLYGVLQHSGAELSAHETITTEQDRWGSIAQLAAEYDTIAAPAQHDRWTTLITTSGLTTDQAQAVIDSDAFGALTAKLRRAEANHHNVDTLLPRLIKTRGFTDADDIASIIHHRLANATTRSADSGRTRYAPRLIAGLIPEAAGPMTSDMRHALDERRELIETCAGAVLDTARAAGEAWTRPLGDPPRDPRKAAAWRRYARTIAAYHDRYGITEDTPLGPVPDDAAQKIDRARAEAALRQLASQPEPHSRHRPPAPTRHGPTL